MILVESLPSRWKIIVVTGYQYYTVFYYFTIMMIIHDNFGAFDCRQTTNTTTISEHVLYDANGQGAKSLGRLSLA